MIKKIQEKQTRADGLIGLTLLSLNHTLRALPICIGALLSIFMVAVISMQLIRAGLVPDGYRFYLGLLCFPSGVLGGWLGKRVADRINYGD